MTILNGWLWRSKCCGPGANSWHWEESQVDKGKTHVLSLFESFGMDKQHKKKFEVE